MFVIKCFGWLTPGEPISLGTQNSLMQHRQFSPKMFFYSHRHDILIPCPRLLLFFIFFFTIPTFILFYSILFCTFIALNLCKADSKAQHQKSSLRNHLSIAVVHVLHVEKICFQGQNKKHKCAYIRNDSPAPP